MTTKSGASNTVLSFKALIGFSAALALILCGALVLLRMFPTLFIAKTAPVTARSALVRYQAPPIRDLGDQASLLAATDNSIRYLRTLSPSAIKGYGRDSVTVGELLETLQDFKGHLLELGLSPEFFSYVRREFVFYKTSAERTLVTGYYEAEVEGSLVPTDEYRYPLYAPPPDLASAPIPAVGAAVGEGAATRIGRRLPSGEFLPYYTREEIDGKGALQGRGLELVFLRDPVARFFLHIQGSGIVTLPDKSTRRFSFAAKNGQPYRPIGRYLVERGILSREQVTMQSIQQYLREHPEQRDDVLAYDPSYVFFRPVQEGPIGSIGVPLSPLRSIATDSSLFPKGGLAFLITELPAVGQRGEPLTTSQPFAGFMLNQDTGGAIRGPGRVDLFTGRGVRPEATAGLMKQSGVLYFLRRRPQEALTAQNTGQ
jgi:membrane-bound lytic murein transglycosylase A